MGVTEVLRWLKRQDARAAYQVREIAQAEQDEWLFDGLELRHRLGRFFSIAGFHYVNSAGFRIQPLIRQPEIGCLGWVTRPGPAGPEFLLQAKYEPGNCNGVQIAPTVQATKSNQERIHGGAEVPFLGFFQRNGPRPLTDGVQTEESDRFLQKLNRNVAVEVQAPLDLPEQFHWCDLSGLKAMLALSHTVNTDARSVLTCLDWRVFRSGSSPNPALAAALLRSLDATPDPDPVRARVAEAREHFGRLQTLALDNLPGWRLEPAGLIGSEGTPFSIRYFHIRTQLREVPEWCQPLVVSHTNGQSILALSVESGVARVYVRIRQAPGVRDGGEVGPSCQFAPGELADRADSLDRAVLDATQSGRLLHEADNSQEGSRFYKDSIRYRIALVDADKVPDTHDGVWTTLATVKDLIDRGPIVSNEMRSALSFLLPML